MMKAAAAVEDAGDSLLYHGDDSTVKTFLFTSTLHISERVTTGEQTIALYS